MFDEAVHRSVLDPVLRETRQHPSGFNVVASEDEPSGAQPGVSVRYVFLVDPLQTTFGANSGYFRLRDILSEKVQLARNDLTQTRQLYMTYSLSQLLSLLGSP